MCKESKENRLLPCLVSYCMCRVLTSSDVAFQLPPNITDVRIISEISRGVFFKCYRFFFSTFYQCFSGQLIQDVQNLETKNERWRTSWSCWTNPFGFVHLVGAFPLPSLPLSSWCLTKILCYPKGCHSCVTIAILIPYVGFIHNVPHHVYAETVLF